MCLTFLERLNSLTLYWNNILDCFSGGLQVVEIIFCYLHCQKNKNIYLPRNM